MTVCSKRPRIAPTPFNVTVIRIRFNNGAVIEAMFGVHEAIKDIIIFVANLLDIPPESFYLKEAVGSRFDVNTSESIGEIRLVPSAVLHFNYHDKDNNLPLPMPDHVALCQGQREIMTFVGIDITDYKF
uniref:UBX domain-containing protein n=1 Tax=Panagrolaimus superbus TaxID=310955 RepID=A0A914YVY9_9BILA